MGRLGERDDGVVVGEDVGFGEAELVVEDVEELALDAAHVPLAKDTGAERPVDVLQGGVVTVLEERRLEMKTYLVGKNERAQEHSLACPLLEGDLQMEFCAFDVDERDEGHRHLDLCLVEDIGHEIGEVGVVCAAG